MAENTQVPVDPNDPQAGSVGAATLDPRYAEQGAIEYNKQLANQIREFGARAYGQLGAGGLVKTPGAFGVDLVTNPGRGQIFTAAGAQILDAASRQKVLQAQTMLNQKRREDYSNWMEGMAHDLTHPPTPEVGEEEMDSNGNWNMQNSVKMSQKYQQWYQKIRARMASGQHMVNLPGVADAMAAGKATVETPDEIAPIPGTKMFRYRRAGQRGVGLLLSEPQVQQIGGMMFQNNLGQNNPQLKGEQNWPPAVVSPGQGQQQTKSNMLTQPSSTEVGGAGIMWDDVPGAPMLKQVRNHPEMGYFVSDPTAPNGMRNIKGDEANSIRTKDFYDYAHQNIISSQIAKDFRSASVAFDGLARSTMGKAGAQLQLESFKKLIDAGHLDPDFASSMYTKLKGWEAFITADGKLPAHVLQDMLVNGNIILRAYGQHAHELLKTEKAMAMQRGVPKKDADTLDNLIPGLPEEQVPTTKEKPGVPKSNRADTPPVYEKQQQQPTPPAGSSPMDFLRKKGQ